MRTQPLSCATLLALAVASAGAVAASGCAGSFPTPPAPTVLELTGGVTLARFYRVDERLYRSAQPGAGDLRRVVERYHVRTVVKLNAGSDDVPAGVRVVQETLSPLIEPSPERLRHILDVIDRAEQPVLVHCTHGEDCTGLVVALHRVRHGASVDDAYADMVRRGFHPYRGVWRAWARAVGWSGATAWVVPPAPATVATVASASQR